MFYDVENFLKYPFPRCAPPRLAQIKPAFPLRIILVFYRRRAFKSGFILQTFPRHRAQMWPQKYGLRRQGPRRVAQG